MDDINNLENSFKFDDNKKNKDKKEGKQKGERQAVNLDLSHLFTGNGIIKAGKLHHLEHLLIAMVMMISGTASKILLFIGIFFLIVFIGLNSMTIMMSFHNFWQNYNLFKKKKKIETQIQEELIPKELDNKLLNEIEEARKKRK